MQAYMVVVDLEGLPWVRFVRADDAEQASEQAVKAVQDDPNYVHLAKGDSGKPPAIVIQRVIEVPAADPDWPFMYFADEPPPKRWWQFWKR